MDEKKDITTFLEIKRGKGGSLPLANSPCSLNGSAAADYFFGDSLVTGLLSLFVSPAFLSSFFTSGDAAGFAGVAFGSTEGLTAGVGLAGATGVGVDGLVSVLLGVVVLPLQALKAAVLTARTDANINDLLIVFSSEFTYRGAKPPAS
jgi:hypothetical protein